MWQYPSCVCYLVAFQALTLVLFLFTSVSSLCPLNSNFCVDTSGLSIFLPPAFPTGEVGGEGVPSITRGMATPTGEDAC